jgi:prepilin-type N-terminal cleavage/methylation domain-containing protein
MMSRGLFVRGFTLVELTISLAIIAILTAVLLSDYPETATRLTLVNNVQSTALLIREAQVRGSAIDSVNGTYGGYGVYLSLDANRQATLFGDTIDSAASVGHDLSIGDGLYQTSPIDETSTVTKFPLNYLITKLCTGSGYPFTCNTAVTPEIRTMTISFTRPNPEAHIYVNDSTATLFTGGCIEMHSPRAPQAGHVRSIQVYQSGMIRTLLGGCDAN